MAVPLTREERTEYDATEGRIVAARRQLKQIKGIPHEPFGDFLAAVHHLAANDAGPDGRAANEYLNAFSSRREIVATSSAKYEALGKFAEAINPPTAPCCSPKRFAPQTMRSSVSIR